jgi:protocatechuate 3,4-dioxygenase alpha subunit
VSESLTLGRTRAQGERLPLTPAQTSGPYLRIGLAWPGGEFAVPEGTPGAVRIGGQLLDGRGEPITDGLVETWQAGPDGRFHHPDDPRGVVTPTDGFTGFARSRTEDRGHWSVVTLKPGPVPGPDGSLQAPHLAVSVFARGLLGRLVTRLYFPEEAQLSGAGGHAADPVLAAVPAARRPTLVARAVEGGYRLDIRIQGEGETVFLDL